MDTQNLHAFQLVAETGSFSIAAQRLHLTQPAVSKRVAQLEDQLGAALFDRIGRHISLTEAGRALLPRAIAVLRELDNAQQSVRDLAGDVGGELRLATSHHVGLHRLPPVLSFYSEAYPDVKIDIDFMDSEQAYDLTLKGDVELAVITLAPDPQPNIVAQDIWQDPLDFMVPAHHPLSAQAKPSLAMLSEYPAVLPGLGTYTGRIIKGLFDAQGLPLQVAITTNYLETIRMMASVGLGWTVLPRSMADSTLKRIIIDGVAISRTLGVVHHEGRSLSRAALAFMSALAAAADHPARALGDRENKTSR